MGISWSAELVYIFFHSQNRWFIQKNMSQKNLSKYRLEMFHCPQQRVYLKIFYEKSNVINVITGRPAIVRYRIVLLMRLCLLYIHVLIANIHGSNRDEQIWIINNLIFNTYLLWTIFTSEPANSKWKLKIQSISFLDQRNSMCPLKQKTSLLLNIRKSKNLTKRYKISRIKLHNLMS